MLFRRKNQESDLQALREENERLRQALFQETQRRKLQYDNFFAYNGTDRGQKPIDPFTDSY